MKKAVSLFFVIFLLFAPVSAFASDMKTSAFFYDVSKESVREGERVEITVSYDGSSREGVAAFITEVEYDGSMLEYIKTENEGAVRNGHNRTETTTGKISSVFTSKKPKQSDLISGDAFRYVFAVKPDKQEGTTEISVKTSQIAGGDGEIIENDYSETIPVLILPPKAEDSLLYKLSAGNYKLDPAFSSDIFAYNMIVPYEVESLVFDTECADNAICRVNRKNLGAGGSDVDFVFTVTAEDNKTISKYTVTVHREEKAQIVREETSSRKSAATPSSSKASTKASSKTASNKAKTSSSPQNRNSANTKDITETPEALPNSEEEVISPTVIFHQGDYPAFMSGALIAFIFIAAGVLIAFLFTKAFRRKKKDDDNKD